MNNKIDRNEEREQVCSLLLKSGRFQEINSTRLQQLVAKANFHSIYFDLAIQNKDYKECLIKLNEFWLVPRKRFSLAINKDFQKGALKAVFGNDSDGYQKTIQFIQVAISK